MALINIRRYGDGKYTVEVVDTSEGLMFLHPFRLNPNLQPDSTAELTAIRDHLQTHYGATSTAIANMQVLDDQGQVVP